MHVALWTWCVGPSEAASLLPADPFRSLRVSYSQTHLLSPGLARLVSGFSVLPRLAPHVISGPSFFCHGWAALEPSSDINPIIPVGLSLLLCPPPPPTLTVVGDSCDVFSPWASRRLSGLTLPRVQNGSASLVSGPGCFLKYPSSSAQITNSDSDSFKQLII